MSTAACLHLRRGSIRASRRCGKLAQAVGARSQPSESEQCDPSAPQIVALGGGGFSMEREASAARRLRPLADSTAAPARVLPADGVRRRRPLRRALLPPLRRGCEASHVSLFRRDQGTGGVEDDLASAPARAGSDLRRRGQHGEHARRVARARARLDRCEGVAQGHRAVRALGGLAVLVRAGAQRLPRRAAQVRGLGLLPYSNCVHYDAEPASGAPSTTVSSATACAAGFAAEDGVALHFRGTQLERVVSSRADGRAYRVEQAGDGVVRDAAGDRYLGAVRALAPPRRSGPRPRVTPPLEPAGLPGRARRTGPSPSGMSHLLSRWAGAASRWSRRTRCSTTTCCRSRAPREPRILFLPTASGDTTAQINAFQARFATACAWPSTCRCSAWARPGAHCEEIVLEQDIVYVGGGSMRNLLAIWRAHGLDRLLERAWATRHRARRPQRRRDVLVRGRGHPLERPARAAGRARPAGGLADGPRRRRARAPAGMACGVRDGDVARRLGPRRRRRAAVPWAMPRPRRQLTTGCGRPARGRDRGRARASSPRAGAAR